MFTFFPRQSMQRFLRTPHKRTKAVKAQPLLSAQLITHGDTVTPNTPDPPQQRSAPAGTTSLQPGRGRRRRCRSRLLDRSVPAPRTPSQGNLGKSLREAVSAQPRWDQHLLLSSASARPAPRHREVGGKSTQQKKKKAEVARFGVRLRAGPRCESGRQGTDRPVM